MTLLSALSLQHLAEADLVAAQLSALNQHSIVAVTDAAGIIVYANNKFCELSEYPLEELLSAPHSLLNSGHHPSAFFESLWQTISAGMPWHGEIMNKAKSGRCFWVRTTIIPVLDEANRPVHYVGVHTDITERIEAVQALADARDAALFASKVNSEFIAAVSHRLRTPLNGIIGMAELLLDSSLDTDQQEFARTINESANSLLTTLNENLDFSQIDVGRFVSAPEPRLEEVGTLAESAAPSATLPLLRTEKHDAVVLLVDDDRVTRMFLRKAMEESGYSVVEAADGAQALEVAAESNPDVILMDCQLPGMSGCETCSRLIASGVTAPIVMVTGLNDDESVKRAMDAGAADFIPKPVYVPVLRQRVRHIVDMYKAQSRIRFMAYHDMLTGLPNRLMFNDRLQQALAAAQRNDTGLAVIFMDLDKFKAVNDTLGHAAGDLLLKAVADRISSLVRKGDTLSRMGGDEFTLLVPQLQKGAEGLVGIRTLAYKIIEAINKPYEINGKEVFVGTSVGASIYPDDGMDASTLLRHADTAMYEAKSRGVNNFSLYASAMNAHIEERIKLETDLRSALKNNELEVYYQPQVEAASGVLHGLEALVRWNHPILGLLGPSRFIPLAEELGIIDDIGAWVLRTACMQCKIWQQSLDKPRLRISVNLSASQFKSDRLLDSIYRALDDSGLDGESLDLEITESVTMQDNEQVHRTLNALRARGISISMDDFGTGYSSLAYLKRYPINVLKIDQSFVRDIVTDSSDSAIVETIIAMAKTLGMDVIAEGVESCDQLRFLHDKGCSLVQGFLVGKPMPAAHFESTFVEGVLCASPVREPKLRVV